MRKPKRARAVLWAMGAVAGLALLAGVYVYAASEWMLRRTYDIPPQSIPAVTSAEDLAEGRRMAVIVGCWAGCHGPHGEGGSDGAPGIFQATAPTLSDVLPHYSDGELVRLIRFGVKRDGRTAIGMISGTFWPLGDLDLARIVAHLRSQPPSPPVPRERRVEALGRLALAVGKWKTSAGEVDRSIPRWGEQPQRTPFERGRYLASITCSECHGLDFRGREFYRSPPLTIVRAYRPEQFRHLLRTGEPLTGRDLGLMTWVAKNAFFEFTDEEIAGIYEYLTTGLEAP